MDRSSFLLFVRAVLPERVTNPRLGGSARLIVRSRKKPVAVLTFTVQNGRVSSGATCRATTVDRAEIGLISRRLVQRDERVGHIGPESRLRSAGVHAKRTRLRNARSVDVIDRPGVATDITT
jgi:hypothetical protein